MAELWLSFKDYHLSIHRLVEKPFSIGQDADCRIFIDSLAVLSAGSSSSAAA